VNEAATLENQPAPEAELNAEQKAFMLRKGRAIDAFKQGQLFRMSNGSGQIQVSPELAIQTMLQLGVLDLYVGSLVAVLNSMQGFPMALVEGAFVEALEKNAAEARKPQIAVAVRHVMNGGKR